jgi:hypothetical protein
MDTQRWITERRVFAVSLGRGPHYLNAPCAHASEIMVSITLQIMVSNRASRNLANFPNPIRPTFWTFRNLFQLQQFTDRSEIHLIPDLLRIQFLPLFLRDFDFPQLINT